MCTGLAHHSGVLWLRDNNTNKITKSYPCIFSLTVILNFWQSNHFHPWQEYSKTWKHKCLKKTCNVHFLCDLNCNANCSSWPNKYWHILFFCSSWFVGFVTMYSGLRWIYSVWAPAKQGSVCAASSFMFDSKHYPVLHIPQHSTFIPQAFKMCGLEWKTKFGSKSSF